MNHPARRRSHEPLVWLLFAAGGMLAAMLLPALIFVTGIAVPAGLLPEASLDYPRVMRLVGGVPGKLGAFVCVSLLFWHAMHRIFHGLHDLGIDANRNQYRLATYGLAALATMLTGALVFWV